ncbi:MAG: hypothetical protein NTZ55_02490, partial [Candidatus Roizmanbacteria bacterium]|nr:hypothetical protein [Candidatus Roizmanbacteria bacterium]
HITSGDDTTESIANIKLSGHQNAPFSEGNWVHQIMEFFKSGDFECVVTAPAKQTWDASCALPYGPVLGQAGAIDRLTLLPTESNGATLPKELDVYALSAIKVPAERPRIPSTAELAVNLGGFAGLGVLGLGVAGMMGAGLKNAAEHAREGNLTDAMTILAEKASSDKFVIMNGTSSSNWEVAGYGDWMKMFLDGSVNPIFTVLKERIKGNDMRLIEDIPDWAKDYIREIWRRKQGVIVLAHRSTRVENRDAVTKPIFDAGTLLETVKGRGKKQREEEQFNETMTRLPKEQSEIRKMQVAVDKEWGEVIRDIWLKDLNVYLGENVYHKQTAEPTHLSHSVLYGGMPQLARYLLGELSEKSWLWKQINITNTNITRENLLAIFCAHLLDTGMKEYLEVKDWLKKELHIGKEVGREAVREIMKQRVLVYKS